MGVMGDRFSVCWCGMESCVLLDRWWPIIVVGVSALRGFGVCGSGRL